MSDERISVPRPYVIVDASIDEHPRLLKSAPWGSIAFQFLLRLSKRMGLRGHLPREYFDGDYIADALRFPREHGYAAGHLPDGARLWSFNEVFQDALGGILKAELVWKCDPSDGCIEAATGCYYISGWAKYQRDPMSGAERAAKHKAKQDAIEKEAKADARAPDAVHERVVEIFDYWREKCGHPDAKLTPDRDAKIRARIVEGASVEKCKQAIDGCVARGPIEGKLYNTIGLIFRNADKFDQFVTFANGKATAPPKPKRKSILWPDWNPADSPERPESAESAKGQPDGPV